MPVLRLFAAAREAAGTGRDEIGGATVADVLEAARARYGEPFTAVLRSAKVWVNGEPADDTMAVCDSDEVAVLPPVSGGCGRADLLAVPGGSPDQRPPPAPAPEGSGSVVPHPRDRPEPSRSRPGSQRGADPSGRTAGRDGG